MKKFRFLLAVIVVFSLLSTFAMAANDTIYIDDVEYTAGAGTVDITIKSNVTRNLTAIFGALEYDPTIWSLENKTGTPDQYYPDNDGGYVDLYPESIDVVAGEAIVTFTATCLDEEAAVGSTFKLAGITINGDSYSDYLANEVADYQTITVKGATAEIAKTITKGGKEYTSVPNKNFAIDVADLANIAGNVTVTYTGEGTKNTSFTEPFTFAIPNGTGSGTATFDVAIVGVPSYITVTDIIVNAN